jgi:hypothetical protein
MFIVGAHCIDKHLLLLQIVHMKIEDDNVKINAQQPTNQMHRRSKDE